MAMTSEITFHGKENIFALYFYAVCARACVLVCVWARARRWVEVVCIHSRIGKFRLPKQGSKELLGFHFQWKRTKRYIHGKFVLCKFYYFAVIKNFHISSICRWKNNNQSVWKSKRVFHTPTHSLSYMSLSSSEKMWYVRC